MTLTQQYKQATDACNAAIGTDAFDAAARRQFAIYDQIQAAGERRLGWVGDIPKTEATGRWQDPTGDYRDGWTVGD